MSINFPLPTHPIYEFIDQDHVEHLWSTGDVDKINESLSQVLDDCIFPVHFPKETLIPILTIENGNILCAYVIDPATKIVVHSWVFGER